MITASAAVPGQAVTAIHGDGELRSRHLRDALAHAAHLLPAQGPITGFIHHNTLHAFEDRSFDQAVQEAGRIFGCKPYLAEERYREACARGRIRQGDLEYVLHRDLGPRGEDRVLNLCSRYELRLGMLRHPLQSGPAAELRWFVAETDALRKVRPDVPADVKSSLITDTRRWVLNDLSGENGSPSEEHTRLRDELADLFRQFGDPMRTNWSERNWEQFTLQALWRVCRAGVRGLKAPEEPVREIVRHRDLLLEACGFDIDPRVNDVLIRFSAAFLDQGMSNWNLPERDHGYFHAFCSLYRHAGGPPDSWLRGLSQELARLQDSGVGPVECVIESLDRLGVTDEQWEEYFTATLLALRGWAGMIVQVEKRNDTVAHPIPEDSLVGFLAVRLLLERFALLYGARTELDFDGPLNELRAVAQRQLPRRARPSVDERAFQVFQIAQIFGWSPHKLRVFNPAQWQELVDEISAFSNVERRRLFHAAYERRYFTGVLDALSFHGSSRPRSVPRFQVVCCIDDREESFRRHLEELSPDVETFGAAGFYGVAMLYRGVGDAHFVPLCPAAITPEQWVEEQVIDASDDHHRRKKIRRAVGGISLWTHSGSRTIGWGALLSAGVGVLAAIPLVSRVLCPRLAAKVHRRFGGYVEPSHKTRLTLERKTQRPGPSGDQLGYSLDEMIDIAEGMLRQLALNEDRFARLVLVLGHGSNSVNNPHEAAYNCGACGGAVGGPNGRAFAQICNDHRVRKGLAERGIRIPQETVFVGGVHITSSEYVRFFDVDLIPASHLKELEELRRLCERALDHNAHERSRRFESAPLSISLSDARRHTDARAEDLAQVRPELGHATNAITIVGRRSRTRGLFFDRRAFLTTYDPTQDDADATILERTMRAIVPVCAGIGLEYFFSNVDPYGYGCSTKLPHNVSALLGVMDGAASDLRTGLPWQMVEVHEPLRHLFIVETTLEAMQRVMERDPSFNQLCRNQWIYLALLSPETSEVLVYRDGEFHRYQPEATELPGARSSIDWYRGSRDHLEIAEIGA